MCCVRSDNSCACTEYAAVFVPRITFLLNRTPSSAGIPHLFILRAVPTYTSPSPPPRYLRTIFSLANRHARRNLFLPSRPPAVEFFNFNCYCEPNTRLKFYYLNIWPNFFFLRRHISSTLRLVYTTLEMMFTSRNDVALEYNNINTVCSADTKS